MRLTRLPRLARPSRLPCLTRLTRLTRRTCVHPSHLRASPPASATCAPTAPSTWQAPLPRVHCHCFSKAEDPVADVIAQAEAILGCPLPGATAHIVRDVSPHKLMMCVSFLLPDAVCWADGDEGAAASAASGSDQKRQRSE